MSDETRDKVQLIALLEIIFLTFIAIFSIAFISVPNLFIQNSINNANNSYYEKLARANNLSSTTTLPPNPIFGGQGESSGESGENMEPEEIKKPDFEGIESAVSRLLIFVDFALMFQLIIHTLIVIGFNKASKQRDAKEFRPWFIFNCIFLPVAAAGTIYGFVRFYYVPIAAFNHILNFSYVVYKIWALYTVFIYMRELKNRITLNSGNDGHKNIDED